MIPAVRGTHDIVPGEVERWQHVEAVARTVLDRYGYAEVRTPILEREELFAKGTGETTDIVQKEMYTFVDKGGERVTLRPEATPSIVRAFVEQGLEQKLAVAKLYCIGPMFRYERPQKGRQRQFHQINAEVFGIEDPGIDAEVIEMVWRLVTELKIPHVEALINSVGCAACRPAFDEALRQAVAPKLAQMCQDCQRRAAVNPLRIFDCKVPADQPVIDALPRMMDFLCEPCRTHFEQVRADLDVFGVPYTVLHRLVRGLDYYTRTTFEIVTSSLGAQNALLGGGRYDGLVKLLGGPDRTGIGFAAGMERLVLALPERAQETTRDETLVVALGPEARRVGMEILQSLRDAGLSAQMQFDGRSLRAQLRLADRLGVRCVVMIGTDELASGQLTVRDMRTGSQSIVARDSVIDMLRQSRDVNPQSLEPKA